MKTGAFDYVVKPLEPSTFLTVVRHALAFAVLTHDREALRVGMLNRKLSQPEAFAAMVTVNPEMLALFGYLETVARTSQPVLITGETGVGKELLAKAVHQASGRQGPLVAVNVAGEASKSGVSPAAAEALIDAIGRHRALRCEGLMTMPPLEEVAEASRPRFAALRALRDRLATPDRPLRQLSMGTTADFEVAIEEGATLVRVGTAIFGPRSTMM